MKKSETKIAELKKRLSMDKAPSLEFIQFVSDVIKSMPEEWQDPMSRAYLEGRGQLFDENTGKPLTSDSRYHIMTEHSRRCFMTMVEVARKHPAALRWLLEEVSNG